MLEIEGLNTPPSFSLLITYCTGINIKTRKNLVHCDKHLVMLYSMLIKSSQPTVDVSFHISKVNLMKVALLYLILSKFEGERSQSLKFEETENRNCQIFYPKSNFICQ